MNQTEYANLSEVVVQLGLVVFELVKSPKNDSLHVS